MKVTFQIENAAPVIAECGAGDNLLELARRANVAIDAPCSGNGSCGKCRVKLVSGELDSIKSRHIRHLGQPRHRQGASSRAGSACP